MHMSIESQNPNFSYLIRKNPENGLMLRRMKKGVAFGWYDEHKPNMYHLMFKETGNEISYKMSKNDAFDYLNVTQYNFPLIPIHLSEQFLKSVMNGDNDIDTIGFTNKIVLSMIEVKKADYIGLFNKYFADTTITAVEIAKNQYEVTFQTEQTLAKLLHLVVVFCIFTVVNNRVDIMLEVDLLQKYAKSITTVNAPFFIRYLFVLHFLRYKKSFDLITPLLSEGENETYTFAYGSTHRQRFNFIKPFINFEHPILDVGAGEGVYAIPFSQELVELPYFAIDIDAEVRHQLLEKVQKKDITNITILDNLDTFLNTYDNQTVDIILTEVIEHMPQDEAKDLVQTLLAQVRFSTFVITTPNQDFNTYYQLEELKRHDDHKWEMGSQEWETWMKDILATTTFDYTFYPVGDMVNNIATSQACIITTKGGDTQ